MTTKGPKQKRKKTMVLLAVICGVLLVGCLSCLVLGNLAPDEPAATPMALATATYVRPEPEIVEPTSPASPVPAHTPQPTAVPIIAPTSTPQPTIDNTSNYREEMYLLLVQYVEVQETAAELNRQGANDSSLLLDSQWKMDMALTLGRALIIGSEIRALEPPQEFQETHSCLVKATEYYDAFVNLYTVGVDTLDASLIVRATDELTLATEWMNKAVEAMPD